MKLNFHTKGSKRRIAEDGTFISVLTMIVDKKRRMREDGGFFLLELRGDAGGHVFHGNQHTGGKGGHSSLKVMGNVVIGPNGPQTSKEYAFALRTAGYTGPLSYPKGKLKELYDVHVKGKTESVDTTNATGITVHAVAKKYLDPDEGTISKTKAGDVWVATKKYDGTMGWKKADIDTKAALAGQPPGHYKVGTGSSTASQVKPVVASHKGVDYETQTGANLTKGAIDVSTTGKVKYYNGTSWEDAGPGTTAAFTSKAAGTYIPKGTTSAPIKTATGTAPAKSHVTSSVKTLTHEVDASTSHMRGEEARASAVKKLNQANTDNYAGSPNKTYDSGLHEKLGALGSYKGSGSSAINKSLSAGKPTAQAKRMKALMDDPSTGSVTKEKMTLDRGVSGQHATDLRDLKPGAVIEYKNFISTTYSQVSPGSSSGHHSAASGFGHAGHHLTVMRITTPAGTKYLPGTDYEKELILAPGKLKVSHMSEGTQAATYSGAKPFTIIHFDYVGDQ